MSTDPTEYPRPLEPTQESHMSDQEEYLQTAPRLRNPCELLPYDDSIPPPPPPWRDRHRRRVAVVLVMCLVAVVLSSVLFSVLKLRLTTGQQAQQQTTVTPVPTTATPTATATVNSSYTVQDIGKHIQAVQENVSMGANNETIYNFSSGYYQVDVIASSSVDFCACEAVEVCANGPQHFGVWVYSSPQEAMAAYQQVISDSLACTIMDQHPMVYVLLVVRPNQHIRMDAVYS